VSAFLQTDRLEGRDELAPLVDGCTGDSKHARYGGSVISKVFDDICSTHRSCESTAVDDKVKRSRLTKASSRKHGVPIGYLQMKKPPRVSPVRHFDGDVIRKLREGRDLSQPQLAELIGTTKGNVSKWELARQPVAISYDLFLNLAKALYVAPEELARRLSSSSGSSSTPQPSTAQRRPRSV
jgi:ribosome-binding protein aMBF1 (putative translation factor)